MNGLRRPVLRFRGTRRACTDQSQPTFCPGADIYAHNAPVCSCCLWRRQLLHSHLAPAQIDFVVGVPAARKYSAQIETVDLGQLSSFYVPRAPIGRQRILARHRNDRHNHEILADALR